ncbi:hypothetical protein MUG78_09675 [Gordonia alkaliphila]|uniref:divisome protein SepX/GlpR n=1 Tax=Gordonia alkaliphila TaxID=1053547 RepID=UPI001FF42AD5|nr:gephyrin-like molybdotransferase receptor GlpR [Gordonia alkaliphila]MCK0439725.1 hypothetical protein [Gordonia alkaliphila]
MNSSVLWIFLIVAWLFILLPMVLRGRPEVRKTTEAAANTRLLHRGGQRATAGRRSAGRHPSDPSYVRKPARTSPALQRPVLEETPMDDSAIDETAVEKPAVKTADVDDVELAAEVTDVLDAVEVAEDDIVDAETVEEPAEAELDEDLDDDVEEGLEDELDEDLEDELDEDLDDELDKDLDDELDDDLDDEYEDDLDDEYDDEATDEDLDDEDVPARPEAKPRELRGRAYTPDAIAERDARRYRERQRIVAGLVAATVLAIASCFFWQPYGYLATGVMVVLSGLYLYFLRRTAVAEQQYRAQRAARLRRHAAEDERLRREQERDLAVRPEMPASPVRRRPGGMVVLELDDEDPSFDHLPTYDFAYANDAQIADDYRHAV